MTHRSSHLVGSMPLPDTQQAMQWGVDTLGPSLHSLPDGEPGERSNWIIHIIESFRQHPDMEVSRDGDWSDIDHTPRFRVARGHTLKPETLNLGIATTFAQSYPVFQQVRTDSDRPDLSFQLGVPGPMDLAGFTFGLAGGVRHHGTFLRALAQEITTVQRQAQDDVLIQLEIPMELIAVSQAPRLLQRPLGSVLARSVAKLAAHCPEQTRFGVHLCYGDLQHKALGKQGNTASGVAALLRSVLSAWPAQRRLEYLHFPVAAGEHGAPLEAQYYAPLRHVTLPHSTRLIAGFVHEDHDLAAHQQVLQHIESAVGRRVDVAAACGLGRRDLSAAEKVNSVCTQLCSDEA